jgi:hypothetical protein
VVGSTVRSITSVRTRRVTGWDSTDAEPKMLIGKR